jgi:hypothetical protein
MSSLRRAASALAAGALLVTALVPGVLAADPLVVSGTVTMAGAPVPGVSVTVMVVGSDTAMPATSDASGAWSVAIDALPGDALQVDAVSSSSSTDPSGCVRTDTLAGRVTVAVDALPASVEVVLTGRSTNVCTATGTPDAVVTPPATDAAAGSGARGSDTGVLLAVLATVAAIAFVVRLPARRATVGRRRP